MRRDRRDEAGTKLILDVVSLLSRILSRVSAVFLLVARGRARGPLLIFIIKGQRTGASELSRRRRAKCLCCNLPMGRAILDPRIDFTLRTVRSLVSFTEIIQHFLKQLLILKT